LRGDGTFDWMGRLIDDGNDRIRLGNEGMRQLALEGGRGSRPDAGVDLEVVCRWGFNVLCQGDGSWWVAGLDLKAVCRFLVPRSGPTMLRFRSGNEALGS
jgi:hypothetical protein